MVRSKGQSRTGLYAVVAVVVVVVIILAAGYAAGWFKTSSTTATSKGCTLPAVDDNERGRVDVGRTVDDRLVTARTPPAR